LEEAAPGSRRDRLSVAFKKEKGKGMAYPLSSRQKKRKKKV